MSDNEKIVDRSKDTTPDSGAHNAVDLDVVISETRTSDGTLTQTGQGSAVSIGDGILLTAAHNYVRFDEGTNTFIEAKSISARLREGLNNEGGHDRGVDSSERHNVGNYEPTKTVKDSTGTETTHGRTDDDDFAVLTTDIDKAPTASMIVFQNPNDAEGSVRSFGYPGLPGTDDKLGGESLRGETLVETSGTLSKDSFRDGDDSQYLMTNADTAAGADDGMGAIGGHSGGGVWLDQTLESGDTRLTNINLENKLAGTMTYGSQGKNPDFDTSKPISPANEKYITSYDSEKQGSSFTPITKDIYGEIGEIASEVSTEKHKKETFEAGKETNRVAAKAEAKAADEKYSKKQADRDFKDEIERDPDIDNKVADRYAENIMVANQSVTNETAANANAASDTADRKQMESTFDGSAFNETMYTNQNVSMNIDLGDGVDTADYFVLSSSVNVTVGADNIAVQKSYQVTEEREVEVQQADGTMKTETQDVAVTRNAVDTVTNAENIVGTGSNDTFLIQDLAGVDKLDGRDFDPVEGETAAQAATRAGWAAAEADSLTIDGSITNVNWTFEKNPDGTPNYEQGTVSKDGQSVEFDNMERVMIRPGDTVDGVAYTGTASMNASEIPAQRAELSIPDAATKLMTDIPIVQAELGAKAANGTMTAQEASMAEVLNTTMAPVLLRSLHDGGVENLDMTDRPMDTAFNRVDSVLKASQEAFQENELPTPDLQMASASPLSSHIAEQDNTPSVEEDYGHYA